MSIADGIRIALDWPRGDFRLALQVELPGRGVTAVHGPSGSGKSTLLRCIAGLDHAPGARISVNGQVWQDAQHFLPSHRRGIGMVFQDASLFEHLDVRGNLHYGLRRKPGADPALLETAIQTLAIGALLDRRPEQLSGGERQRVAIARALALAPQLLLMDEPLSALDAARKQELLPYLERLHDALAIPLLYVSHAADEVARLADHLLLLDAGRVRAVGPMTGLLGRLDPPVALGNQLGVVLATEVAERDPAFHLVRLQFDGGSLWARDPGQPIGQSLR
ncbi:MAG: molybdenum ABC transporter ATP-binding protein, partial [Lysobacterales bacterium]